MRIIHNFKHREAIHLKFGDNFLTILTKLVLQVKAVSALLLKKSTFTWL